MFSYIRRQSPHSHTSDDDLDMDNSYIRELHHRQSTIESKPFDEQTFSEESVYLDALATGGLNVSGIVNKTSSECASQSKNESLTGNHQTMKDLGAGHTSSPNEHSNDESRNPSLGSRSGNLTNTPMSDRSKNLDEVSMLSYSSFSDNVTANSNSSYGSAPSALSGGNKSSRSGQSKYSGNASTNAKFSSIVTTTLSTLSCGHQSVHSGGSSKASMPSTTRMTVKQADDAYSKIVGKNLYDAPTTASSPGISTASDRHAKNTARTEAITTAVSTTASFAATHTTKTVTLSSNSDASAKDSDAMVVTLAPMPSCHNQFPDAPPAVLSFDNVSKYSAAGTVENASILALNETKEADNELEIQVDTDMDVMDDDLRVLENKKELIAKMLDEEKQKEEEEEIAEKIKNGQIVKVTLGKSGDEGESGRGVILAKLMTRSGTLDEMSPLGDELEEQRGVAAQDNTLDKKDTLDKMVEGVLDGPKKQAPIKKNVTEPEAPEQTQDKLKKRTQNKQEGLKFNSHSHSSRGKFSFAKLKSKNLKSKRFFGKKGAFVDVEPRPVKIMPAHSKDLQGESEVELTSGLVHSFSRKPHPKSTISDCATDTSDQSSIKLINSPNKIASNITDTTDTASHSPEVMKRSDSSINAGTRNIVPSSTSMKKMTKDAIEIPQIESNRTDDTQSTTMTSKEEQEMGDVPLNADGNEAANDFSESRTTLSDNVNTGKTSSHKGIYPISFFNQLFACGAAPIMCHNEASVTSSKCDNNDTASLSVATGVSPILLFDDTVDEALNVEIYDDDNNVTHIGTLGQVSRAPKDVPAGPEVCIGSQDNCESNNNDTETKASSKVILMNSVECSYEVIPNEGEGDILVDSGAATVGKNAQNLDKRREKDQLGGVATLKGRKNGLRMKLLKKLKRDGKRTSAVAGVAPSL